MRRGELCGLEWQDVDFITNCLHIRRSSLYIPEKGVFEDEPKNETSKRVIKLSASAVQLLKDYKVWQDNQKAIVGTAWQNTNRLTNATLLIASGAPLMTVYKRLGHSNVSTTGNIYTHAIQSADEAAAEALEDILSPSKQRKAQPFPKAE